MHWSSSFPQAACARGARLLLGRVGDCCFAHPRAFLMRLAARFDALAIAGAVALQHVLEFGPVDGAELVVLGGLVPLADPDPESSGRGNPPAAR